jgi:type IV pilus assembly protein PilB
MQIDEKRKPLDGKFKIEVGQEEVDLRVSTLPTIFGEKCVVRLLRNEGQVFALDQLGLWGEEIKIFNEALSQTTGIILVTGPTGSGKTVTLAASLQKLNSPRVNIITLEDPAEITLPGVNQVQINPQAGLTFASGLRAILRQDPNIIMVGEIRDVETARLAIQAALTGHLVLATLHTNSSAGAIPRLIDMGVEPFLLSSTINVVLAQRLARKICPYCREAYEADEIISKDVKDVLGDRLFNVGIGDRQYMVTKPKDMDQETFDKQFIKNTPGKIILYRGKGCKQCGDTGYKGRIGVYEVMKITTEIQKLTEANASADSIQAQATKEGLIRLVQDGYLKALWGVTTIEEVLTVADES